MFLDYKLFWPRCRLNGESQFINPKRHIYTPKQMYVCNMKEIPSWVTEIFSGTKHRQTMDRYPEIRGHAITPRPNFVGRQIEIEWQRNWHDSDSDYNFFFNTFKIILKDVISPYFTREIYKFDITRNLILLNIKILVETQP